MSTMLDDLAEMYLRQLVAQAPGRSLRKTHLGAVEEYIARLKAQLARAETDQHRLDAAEEHLVYVHAPREADDGATDYWEMEWRHNGRLIVLYDQTLRALIDRSIEGRE